jgi:hypothetical protein
MISQIVAKVIVFKAKGTPVFEKPIGLPIDPNAGMHLKLTCEDSEGKVINELSFKIESLIYEEEQEKIICLLEPYLTDTDVLLKILNESANWKRIKN